MRVTTYNSSASLVTNIQQLSGQQSDLQYQISTGQRVFKGSDDPAAMTRLVAIGVEKTRLNQFQSNADNAMTIAQRSNSVLQQLSKVSTRASELGLIVGNSRDTNVVELNQLIEQAVEVGNSRFGGEYIFSGTATDTKPYEVTRDASGNITSVAFNGNTDSAPISISESTSISPRINGQTSTDTRDFIQSLIDLRDAMNANDDTAVAAAANKVGTQGDKIVDAISENGGIQLRIELVQTQHTQRSESLEKLASPDVEADLPSTLVKLNQASTAYQAALASATKILQTSLLDYLR